MKGYTVTVSDTEYDAMKLRIAQLEARTNQDMVRHIAILEERIEKYAGIETHAKNCARIAEERWQRIAELEAENERLLSAVCQWSENCVAERQCVDQQMPLSPDPDPIDVSPPCDSQQTAACDHLYRTAEPNKGACIYCGTECDVAEVSIASGAMEE